MMNAETDKFDGKFLVQWILFTTGACILSLPVGVIVPELGGGLIAPACIGAIVAYGQWLVLSKRIALSRWWVLAGAIGLGVTFPIGFGLSHAGFLPHFFNESARSALGSTTMGVVAGLLSGILQLPLLKPHFERAVWWTPASALGSGLCLLAGSSIDGLITLASSNVAGSANLVVGIVTGLTAFVGGILFSIPLGVVTGVGLLWIAQATSQPVSH